MNEPLSRLVSVDKYQMESGGKVPCDRGAPDLSKPLPFKFWGHASDANGSIHSVGDPGWVARLLDVENFRRSCNVQGTQSGRFSCEAPNVSNIGKGKK